jgi:hypothetical protein
MKKLILITILTFVAITTYGQNFKTGNFVGFHVLTITLNPNITMDQFLDVWENKLVPEQEKNFECKAYIVKGIRGECKDCFGLFIVWESEAGRDKFFKPEGELSDLGIAASAKMKPVTDELAKLGTYTSKYTDWVVQ